MRRTLAMMLTAGLVLLGCTGTESDNVLDLQTANEPEPEPAEGTDPTPEVEAEVDPEPEAESPPEAEDDAPDDPYAVPDEIDEAYVERVINAILEVQSEVLRGALQQQQGENLDPELMALHFATTDGRQRQLGLDEYQGYIDDPESRGGLRSHIEEGTSSRFEVEYIHHVEVASCLLALGYWDRTGLSSNAPSREETLTAVSLSRIRDQNATSSGNPTPWQWRHNLGLDGNAPASEWTSLPWSDSLDHACNELDETEGGAE